MEGHVRRATKADHEDIISIIPIGEFDGEYLPDCLPYFRENPLYTDMVYITDNKIIGYMGVWLIDNGSTACFTNGRVHKEYQGKGINGILAREHLKFLPTIKCSTFATFINLDQVYKKISENISRLISVRKCFFYAGFKKYIIFSALREISGSAVIKVLSKEDLSLLFAEKHIYPNVFNNDRLLVLGVPYKVLESNVSTILMERTRAIASFLESRTRTLLTFGTHFRQPNGDMFCTIDTYGTLGDTLYYHILLHIEAFLELIDNYFTIEIRYNEYSYAINQTIDKIGLFDLSSGSRRTECVVSEQSHDLVNPASKL